MLNLTLKTPRDEARAHGMINAACMLHNLILNVHPDTEFDLAIDDLASDDDDDDSDRDSDDGDSQTEAGVLGSVPINQRRREEVCSKLLELLGDD